MARTELTVTTRPANGRITQPAGTAGTVDGHFIDTHKRTTINDDVKPELLTLTVTVATAASNVTIKAGEYPPALDSGVGDLVLNCPVGVSELGPFTSGRFLRRDGKVWIDYEIPANVTVRAYRHPRNV